MTLPKDPWVKTAMTDDTIVVDFLVRLKHQSHSPFPPAKSSFLPFKWGLRLPRSKPTTCEMKDSSACRGGDLFSASPTTPLSWSAGGSDDSSRSKATVATEPTSNTNSSKRTRRKKTFAELKEEENMLLKEGIHLEKDLVKLRVTFNEQRAANHLLKRIKFDLGLHAANDRVENVEESKETMLDQQNPVIASTTNLLRPVANDALSAATKTCQPLKAVSSGRDTSFLLPDLNMTPSEESPGCKSVNGTS